jgi:hypothetical protein
MISTRAGSSILSRYWSPEQGRGFLNLVEGDRTERVWALVMCSGLRIGELGTERATQ